MVGAPPWRVPVEGLAPIGWVTRGLIGSRDRATEGGRAHRGHTRICDPESARRRNQGATPMSAPAGRAHDPPMHQYLLYHRHGSGDCATSFAAWNGFHSALRRTSAPSTCAFGGHEVWWSVTAADDCEALALLPKYVADRTLAVRCSEVDVP